MEAANEALLQVRSLLRERAPREVVLNALARYYHVSIIGHFYLRVNNSLLMAQVNSVFLELGIEPIYHSHHDYVMLMLDSTEAQRYFREQMVPGT